MIDRGNFIKQISAEEIDKSYNTVLLPQQKGPSDKIWAGLLHLSFNFALGIKSFGGIRTEFEPVEQLWSDILVKMAKEGMNMVVIDLGDAIRYDSHPEIAVKNAWSPARLREELEKIRNLGMEPIPLLNFSTGHDAWLGTYSHMVSTDIYYTVCKDLIKEVTGIFNNPRFFHLGMDEETAENQLSVNFDHIIVRQNDLWWGDFYFLIGEVFKNGSRPWVWSDYYWHHPDLFLQKMPKSVVQSNWYYGEDFDETKTYVKAYLDLERNGYDQIPTGSYHENNEKSILNTVQFCEKNINEKRLLGFFQTFWKPIIEEYRERILKGTELTGNAKKIYEEKHPVQH
ncbi:MAG: Tat pathway signal protein [Bacteroidales bacterium]|nr:Tat pathway signal protein [Bacteroidales bacterium]